MLFGLLISIVAYKHFFYINRIVYSVFSQNLVESVFFTTAMEHSWYICCTTTQSIVFLMCWVIVEAQLYSRELFCHSGLEPCIFCSLFPAFKVLDLFHICPYKFSPLNTLHCVLCLFHIPHTTKYVCLKQ